MKTYIFLLFITNIMFKCYISILIFKQVYGYQEGWMNAFTISKLLKIRDNKKQARSSSSSNLMTNHTTTTTTTTIITTSQKKKLNYNSMIVQQHFFQQRLDHFASHPCDTMRNYIHNYNNNNDYNNNDNDECYTKLPTSFQQQFFYSDRFVRKKQQDIHMKQQYHPTITDIPTYAFLCIGGEGPTLDTSVLIDSIHCTGDMIELAEKLYKNHGVNVHLFALEHRYYGLSYPVFDNNTWPISNHHLIYLSSKQALSDLATFIIYMNNHPNFLIASTNTTPWIAFGGSYPGMLSAWLRLKFPHLVLGSISNSAPIEVVENFYQYKEKVASDIANINIGGSPACLDRIQQGHEELYELLKSGMTTNINRIADMFQICNGAFALSIEANIKAFLGDGAVDIPAQENDPTCREELCNVEKICDFLINFQGENTHPTSYHVQALAALSKAQIQASSLICKNIDWHEMLSFLSSRNAQIEGIRSWLWQTCTEFGFFQTCPMNSTCPFGRGLHDVQQDLDICRVVFGIPSDLVKRNIDETLAFYGGWILQGTNILSINGDIDPWSTMSAKSTCIDTTNCTSNSPTLWVRGTSHHIWTHKTKTTDAVSIVQAREFIYSWVIDLLHEERSRLEAVSVVY